MEMIGQQTMDDVETDVRPCICDLAHTKKSHTSSDQNEPRNAHKYKSHIWYEAT
jgi:hypothetical protein